MAEKERYRGKLKEAGLRHTLPRDRILAVLDRKNAHYTAEEIFKRLRDRGFDVGLSTIYLNLHVLREHGIIQEFRDLQGNTRYDGWTEPHLHLVSLEDGRIEDLPLREIPEVDLTPILAAIEAKTGWKIKDFRLEFRGSPPQHEE